MRKILCSPSLAFDSAHVKYGVWTWPKGPGKRRHIVAHDVSWAAQTEKHLLRTQNLRPQQMLRARANGETFVSATMCPQPCVLVCQGLKKLKVCLIADVAWPSKGCYRYAEFKGLHWRTHQRTKTSRRSFHWIPLLKDEFHFSCFFLLLSCWIRLKWRDTR